MPMIVVYVTLWSMSVVFCFFLGVYVGGVRWPGTMAAMNDDELGQLADKVQQYRAKRASE